MQRYNKFLEYANFWMRKSIKSSKTGIGLILKGTGSPVHRREEDGGRGEREREKEEKKEKENERAIQLP